MIKFIYGKDDYRASQKIKEIIDDYKALSKNKVILSYFDCKNDFYKFQDEFKTISIFGERKIAVLTNFFSDSAVQKEVLNFLKNKKELTEKEDLILFYEQEKKETKSLLFNFLKKNGDFQRFDLLEDRDLFFWIKEEFKKHNTQAEKEAIENLANFVGNNLWLVSNEIKKLVLYKKNKSQKIITKKDFDLLIVSKIEPVIFETIEAMSLQDKRRALALLHYHLEKGDPPFLIFSKIKWQFSNLLMVKDLIERRKGFLGLKMHPFVLKKSCQLVQRFSMGELKKIYKKIFQLDIKIKTGKIEPVLAIDMFIGEL